MDLSKLSDEELGALYQAKQPKVDLSKVSDDDLVKMYYKAQGTPEKTGVTSPLEAAAIQTGRTFDRLAAGLRHAVHPNVRATLDWLNDKFGMAPPPSIDPEEQARLDESMRPLEAQFPKSTFLADTGVKLAAGGPTPFGQATIAALDYGTPEERNTRALLTYAFGKAGQNAGETLAERFAANSAAKAAGREATRQANIVRDASIADVKSAGYKLPPTMVNPNAANSVLEGVSGKLKTAQLLSQQNEPVTLSLAKRAVSLPDNMPLTPAALKEVRSAAGGAYDALKKFGTFTVDNDFHAARSALAGDYKLLVADHPEMRIASIESTLKTLDRMSFNSTSAVELVKRLRFDGYANMKAGSITGDPEKLALGALQLDAKEALEQLMERNLQKAGQGDFMQVFRNARTLIAKTHTVENALDEASGKVVAGKVSGKHLTDELATIQKMAKVFPKAVQHMTTSVPAYSPLDYMAGLVTAGASGNPLGGAAMMARPLVRSTLLSPTYQRLMVNPNYSASLGERFAASLGSNPNALTTAGGLFAPLGPRFFQPDNRY